MTALIWAANLLGWPMIHLAIGFVALRLPPHLFVRDTWLTAPRRWERHGRLYRDWLAIRNWKSLLPDGAPWLGGFAKKKLRPRFMPALRVSSSKRAAPNWRIGACSVACPLFFLWNPPGRVW